MDRDEFLRHYRAFERGHITRRQLLQVTGLTTAAAVLAACAPSGAATSAPASSAPASSAPASSAPSAAPTIDPNADWAPPAGVDLGKELQLTTWPNYHDPKTIQQFTDLTGVQVNLTIFRSN